MEDKIKSFKGNIDDIKRDQGVVTIAISKFDQEDRAEDIVRKGAFEKSFEDMSRIKHCIDHKQDLDHVVGTPRKAWESDEYALVESKLILGKTAGHDAFEYYKHCADEGRQVEHSYCYRVLRKNHNETIAGDDIAELQLKYEYSTVFAGCNPSTPALDVKGLHTIDDVTAYQEQLNNLLRKCDFSDGGGRKIEHLIKKIEEGLAEARKQVPNDSTSVEGIIEILRHSFTNH